MAKNTHSRITLPKGPRVLVVMMSAVGDAVHTLPVITALKRHDPSVKITWILQPGPASLMEGHPDVDEILRFDRRAGWRAYPGMRRLLAGREFDIVLDLQVYFKASIVTAMARAPIKLGFDRARARDLNWLVTTHRIPPHPPQHVQDQYFEFLKHLGVAAEPVEWKLGPWPHEIERQAEFLGKFDRPIVSLVIGTSKKEREWVAERWADLADALYSGYGLQPVLAGGRSDREVETERRILARARHPVASTLGLPLRDLVGLLDGSELVVTLNTGPMHMAVALGTPVIAMLGGANPRRTGPYRSPPELLVDVYGRPGEDYPISLEKRPSGMDGIRVEDVLDRVERWRMMSRSGSGPGAETS